MPRDFFSTYGPGLFDIGKSLLSNRQVRREDRNRQAVTQTPLQAQQIGLSGDLLSQVQPDLTKAEQEEFDRQEALQAQANLQDQQRLQRELVARGQSGIASHGAVAGTAPTPGQPMNPQLAALFAAQAHARNQRAADAGDAARRRRDADLNAANSLQRASDASLASRSAPNVQNVIAPRRPSTAETVLSGVGDLLKNPQVSKGLFSGLDRLSSLFSGFNSGTSGWDFNSPGWYGSSYGSNDDWLYDI